MKRELIGSLALKDSIDELLCYLMYDAPIITDGEIENVHAAFQRIKERIHDLRFEDDFFNFQDFAEHTHAAGLAAIAFDNDEVIIVSDDATIGMEDFDV